MTQKVHYEHGAGGTAKALVLEPHSAWKPNCKSPMLGPINKGWTAKMGLEKLEKLALFEVSLSKTRGSKRRSSYMYATRYWTRVASYAATELFLGQSY